MQRRDFLKRALQAGTIIPLASSGLFARPLESLFFPRASGAADRILVLINLNGGNDGLNTVIPVNDPKYHNARPNLARKATETLAISDGLALHGGMTQAQALFNDGDCAIVQSVGYPAQDRSHFRSTDIWHTASDADVILHTGWLGRYLQKTHPEFPQQLPNAPFAMQVGSSATLALQSDNGGMGMAIDNPDRFYNLAAGLSVTPAPLPDTLAGPELKFVRDVIEQSNTYSQKIRTAAINGSTNSDYGSDSLAAQLRVVARLINGGLETSIYIVTLGGFDTHVNQLGFHEQRLRWLSQGVKTFLDDMKRTSNGQRVVVMTYSEFGRRLNENGSAGTDHGAAAPQLLFGQPVLGGKVIGGAPNLVDLDNRGDIKYQHDFRQIYASVLQDWMGFSRADTDSALGGDFPRLPLFESPAVGVYDEEHAAMAGYVLNQNTPNPVTSTTAITFRLPQASHVRLNVFTTDGRRLATLVDRRIDAGEHRVPFDASGLPSGTYLYALESGHYKLAKRMAVVK